MSAPNARLAALFVGIVVVLVGGAAVAPYALGPQDDTDPVAVENQQFQPDAILPDETPEEGEITMESDASGKTILVDVGHENGVSKSDLEPLLSTLVENGHRIRFYRGERRSLNASLRSADALLIANPQRRYTGSELAGVEAFTDAGGRVLVLGDPPSLQVTGGLLFGRLQPTADRTTSIGSTYGIAYGSGYLYNMEENDNNYKSIYARPSARSGLADGVDRVVMREAVPLRTAGARRVLVGSQGTHLSASRDPGQYAVVARSGNVTAVGDSDFLTRENVQDADNEVFIGNLADFLVDGEKTPGAPLRPSADDGSESEGGEPQPPAGGEAPPRPTPAPA
ncbi:MAG: DUF4350 domain-containing protein [Haloplanus sp.]